MRARRPALAVAAPKGDDDEVADEEFAVFGVDAVREDVEADAEGDGDEENFGPGGELDGAGAWGRGFEGGPEAAPGVGGFGVGGVGGEAEGEEGGGEGCDARDPGSGFEVGGAAEFR